MEATENKIITSKLNELKTLPKDYQPNLDSKWALLEASLAPNTTDKKRGMFWMRSAAAVLLIGLLGFWIRAEYKVKTIGNIETQVIKELPANKNQPKNRLHNELTVADKFNIVKPRAKLNTSKENGLDQKNIVLETAVLETNEVIEDSMKFVAEPAAQALTNVDAAVKKKKSRYVQIDFDNAIEQGQAIPPEQTLFVKHIKVSLLKNGHETRNVHPSSPPEALFKINF